MNVINESLLLLMEIDHGVFVLMVFSMLRFNRISVDLIRSHFLLKSSFVMSFIMDSCGIN